MIKKGTLCEVNVTKDGRWWVTRCGNYRILGYLQGKMLNMQGVVVNSHMSADVNAIHLTVYFRGRNQSQTLYHNKAKKNE